MSFYRTILLASIMTLGSASYSFALDFDVENNSKTTIHHLYLSATDETKWGDDQLGDDNDDTIEPGDSYTVEDIEPGRYDIKLVTADGTQCIVKNVRFGTDKVWTITEAMLDSCG